MNGRKRGRTGFGGRATDRFPDNDGAMQRPSWFVPMVEDADRPVRVLGLPQAGAGCAAFAGCAERMPADIALFGLNLPGRQARFGEPPIRRLAPLVEGITDGMRPLTDRPYVLFGYCSGALLAFLVARAAVTEGLAPPKALLVASYPAPQLVRPAKGLHTAAPAEFWAEIMSYGGFPAALAGQPEYRQIFEPALRADYEWLAGYEYTGGPPLPVPIVMIAGQHDPVLDEDDKNGWAGQTTAGFHVRHVAGDHWLLDSALDEVAVVLAGECRR
jgi:medium-chain acyl-[acyl-carrier-protein] hydrolase